MHFKIHRKFIFLQLNNSSSHPKIKKADSRRVAAAQSDAPHSACRMPDHSDRRGRAMRALLALGQHRRQLGRPLAMGLVEAFASVPGSGWARLWRPPGKLLLFLNFENLNSAKNLFFNLHIFFLKFVVFFAISSHF